MTTANWEDEAAGELDRLLGLQHEHKRRNTILALVDARLAGRSEETVWDQPETCARSTWHGRRKEPGWKHDLLMQDVLANVERAARRWMDARTLRALAEAAESLALASPAAAAQLIEISTRGRVKRQIGNTELAEYDSASVADVVRAALGVLDRAGIETAPKQQQQVGLAPELEAMIERVYGDHDG